jgi:hypothetical protein
VPDNKMTTHYTCSSCNAAIEYNADELCEECEDELYGDDDDMSSVASGGLDVDAELKKSDKEDFSSKKRDLELYEYMQKLILIMKTDSCDLRR